ncbi:MAG: discoidin domain-containing protein, partial [Planctomycetota bacterium]
RVSSELAFTDEGAELTVRTVFHRPPRHLVFRIPYSVELDAFTSDATDAAEKDGLLFFTPDVTKASITWHPRPGAHDNNYQDILRGYRSEYDFVVEDGNYDPARAGKPFLLADEEEHPAEPLSFDLVRRAFQKEYSRRFAKYAAGGGKPYPVEPPALLCAASRRDAFLQQHGRFDPRAMGIAVDKPVTASASLEAHPARLAGDGVADKLASSWQTDPYPAWLKIDLEKPTKIDRVHVFPYWGAQRYYRYTVEVSADGKAWKQVADMSENSKPAPPRGDLHIFEACQARYVRVNMLYHSLNRGVHLVEVRVFEAE